MRETSPYAIGKVRPVKSGKVRLPCAPPELAFLRGKAMELSAEGTRASASTLVRTPFSTSNAGRVTTRTEGAPLKRSNLVYARPAGGYEPGGEPPIHHSPFEQPPVRATACSWTNCRSLNVEVDKECDEDMVGLERRSHALLTDLRTEEPFKLVDRKRKPLFFFREDEESRYDNLESSSGEYAQSQFARHQNQHYSLGSMEPRQSYSDVPVDTNRYSQIGVIRYDAERSTKNIPAANCDHDRFPLIADVNACHKLISGAPPARYDTLLTGMTNLGGGSSRFSENYVPDRPENHPHDFPSDDLYEMSFF